MAQMYSKNVAYIDKSIKNMWYTKIWALRASKNAKTGLRENFQNSSKFFSIFPLIQITSNVFLSIWHPHQLQTFCRSIEWHQNFSAPTDFWPIFWPVKVGQNRPEKIFFTATAQKWVKSKSIQLTKMQKKFHFHTPILSPPKWRKIFGEKAVKNRQFHSLPDVISQKFLHLNTFRTKIDRK